MPAADHEIPGWFNFHELYSRMVEEAHDGAHFVEVGAWLGKSTAFMGELIKSRADTKYIRFDVVDTWRGTPDEPELVEEVRKEGGTVLPRFIKNMQAAGVLEVMNLLVLPSELAARMYRNLSLDFVYIDACHEYESVARDLKAWWPKIKIEGTLAGHDVERQGVRRAVEDFHPTDLSVEGTSWIMTRRLAKRDDPPKGSRRRSADPRG